MDNIILNIINCILLILVKNVLDIEYDVLYNTMYCIIILILVKNVLDIEYIIPL